MICILKSTTKLTHPVTICHIYLSYKMCYTWQVAGVGAGYIGKKNTTSGCAPLLLRHCNFLSIGQIVARLALERARPPPPGLGLGAWSLMLLSIGHIDARQFAARLGELVFTISNIWCVSIPALSTALTFIALISGWTCLALRWYSTSPWPCLGAGPIDHGPWYSDT